MNARDGFAMWLTGLLGDTPLDDKIQETQEAMDEAFDDYARELAAKLRKLARHDPLKNCTPCATHRYDADVIDIPEDN